MAKAKKRAAGSFDYVLESDRALPPEEQSRFTLRPMTFDEQAAYMDACRGEGDVGLRVWQATVALVPRHLQAVENFPAGNPKPWPSDAAAQREYLADVGVDECFEIGNELYLRSKLGEREGN